VVKSCARPPLVKKITFEKSIDNIIFMCYTDTRKEKEKEKMFSIIVKIIVIIAIIRLVRGVIKVVADNLFLEIRLNKYDNDPERKKKIEEMRKRIEENSKWISE
jgi:hypothetical protein